MSAPRSPSARLHVSKTRLRVPLPGTGNPQRCSGEFRQRARLGVASSLGVENKHAPDRGCQACSVCGRAPTSPMKPSPSPLSFASRAPAVVSPGPWRMQRKPTIESPLSKVPSTPGVPDASPVNMYIRGPRRGISHAVPAPHHRSFVIAGGMTRFLQPFPVSSRCAFEHQGYISSSDLLLVNDAAKQMLTTRSNAILEQNLV